MGRNQAGDGKGTVYLAHAWCPDEHRKDTVGPWHWWNVYQSAESAEMQATRVARWWKVYGRSEVLTITGGTP